MSLLNIARQTARFGRAHSMDWQSPWRQTRHAVRRSGTAYVATAFHRRRARVPLSGFMVTQPGLVSVDIAAGGVPILAALRRRALGPPGGRVRFT